jgi:hypothetical protein
MVAMLEGGVFHIFNLYIPNNKENKVFAKFSSNLNLTLFSNEITAIAIVK